MTRRRFVSSDEAVQATGQHRAPCSDCPWRRDSLEGWLGSLSTEEWIAAAHGEARIECHVLLGAQCAGAAVYRANVCKQTRDTTDLRLPADRVAVFARPDEFREHHGD